MFFVNLLINAVVNIACGALNAWGGYKFIEARRFIMPFVLAVYVSIKSHVWLLGFVVLPAMGTLTLGYFSDKNWGRALWVFVQALALTAGVTILGHLNWLIVIPYLIGAGVLGGVYKNWQQLIGDAAVGVYLSLFIWGIHG